MLEMLVSSIAIALAFTIVICGISYAVLSELVGLKPAQRRVARRRMMKHGVLAFGTLAFGIVLMFHGYSFYLATVIAGGCGLLIFIFMNVPIETSTSTERSVPQSGHRPVSYETPNFERYADSLPGLQKQLIMMLRGDRRAAHDLVLHEKSILPSGHPEAWYWKAAIQRLERDRR